MKEPVVLGQFTTDAQGRFKIAEQKIEYSRRTRGLMSIFVRDDRGRIGGTVHSTLSREANCPHARSASVCTT